MGNFEIKPQTLSEHLLYARIWDHNDENKCPESLPFRYFYLQVRVCILWSYRAGLVWECI